MDSFGDFLSAVGTWIMHAVPGLGNATLGTLGVAMAGLIAAIIFLFLISLLRSVIQVCPPNQVMVVQGAKTKMNGRVYGFRVVRGGVAIVIPFLHRADYLDLSVLPINVQVDDVNSANGITVGAEATACVGVDADDDGHLFTAVERMLGKTRDEIHEQIHQTMVGNFRGAMNRATPLQAMGMRESARDIGAKEAVEGEFDETVDTDSSADNDDQGERARFRQAMLDDANEDLASFGFRVFSVSFQRIWDSSDYISSLATKAVAQKRKEVEIEEARLSSEAERAESDGKRREAIARSTADEKIVKADENLGKVREDVESHISRAKKEADAGIARAKSEAQVAVETAENELQLLRNQTQVTIKPKYQKQAAEVIAEGQNEAVRIRRAVRNDMLQRQADMLTKAGSYGRIPMFIQGQLPKLFKAYQDGAKDIQLDNLTLLGDDDDNGINSAVNRGPAGFVDFIEHFEHVFGIGIRDFVAPRADNDREVTAKKEA